MSRKRDNAPSTRKRRNSEPRHPFSFLIQIRSLSYLARAPGSRLGIAFEPSPWRLSPNAGFSVCGQLLLALPKFEGWRRVVKASGRVSPKPLAEMIFGLTPCDIRKVTTADARRVDRTRLSGMPCRWSAAATLDSSGRLKPGSKGGHFSGYAKHFIHLARMQLLGVDHLPGIFLEYDGSAFDAAEQFPISGERLPLDL